MKAYIKAEEGTEAGLIVVPESAAEALALRQLDPHVTVFVTVFPVTQDLSEYDIANDDC